MQKNNETAEYGYIDNNNNKKYNKKYNKNNDPVNGFAIVLFIAVCAISIKQTTSLMSLAESRNLSFLQIQLFALMFFVVINISILLHTILHETGHLICGLLSGYKFVSFRIINLMWIKRDGKVHFCRMPVAGYSGQCLMSPPPFSDGKIPVFLYNLGGVLVNFLTGVVALILYFALTGHVILSNIFFIFALTGITMALINGVPMRSGKIDNDGRNAYMLNGNEDALRAFWIQLKANELINDGVRLKDMPAEWFVVPADEKMDNSMVSSLCVFSCSRLMDEHSFDEADKLIVHLLGIKNDIVGIQKNLIICDRIYIELIGQNRKDVLDSLLDNKQKKFMLSMKNYPSVIRTEYAYALLSEKDEIKSKMIRESFEKCAETYPYSGDLQSERELIMIADNKNQTTY